MRTIAELFHDPNNPRKHSQRNIGAIAHSLEQVGAARSIVIDEDNVILCGNGLVEAAGIAGIEKLQIVEADGETIVAVRRTGLTKKQKKLMAVADNRSAELAEWDGDVLAEISSGVDLSALFYVDELAEIIGLEEASGGILEGVDVDHIPENVETRCKPGDLWKLGNHRLLCGDSTCAIDVERLMGDELLRLVWTDPPYGVSYSEKNKMLNTVGKGNRIQLPIEGDSGSPEEVESCCRDALRGAFVHALPGAACYVATPGGPLLFNFIRAFMDSGFSYKHSLVWVKNNFVLGRCDYHYKHETILYGWAETGAHFFVDDHTKDTVFCVDKPHSSKLHPTMKPVELVAEMICNNSKEGEIVYEPFGGSGTTLIACEQNNRLCRIIEKTCGYCDVILTRWETATGKKAELLI